QKAVVSGTGWASEQLDGRIAFRCPLPAVLSQEDLTAIARHYLPEAPKELLEFLSAYARRSGKFLAGLEAVSKRARYLARKAGHDIPRGPEVEAAMAQVDPDIAQIFNQNEETQAECKPSAKPKQRACRPAARAVHSPEKQLVPVG
ncbi:MAG TPA: hypothetical protein VLL07_00145, partial [Pontiella sp.]|nr:hypothetical protein [Pontiella sp.]